MVSITLKISADFKALLQKLSWVNWSELARQEIQQKLNEEHTVDHLKKLLKKSTFTEHDADRLSDKVKAAMHSDLKDKGLI